MNLVMTATPLAMHKHDLTFDNTAFVIQWHVVSMFAPSFFTGNLINRFGISKILFTISGSRLELSVCWWHNTADRVLHRKGKKPYSGCKRLYCIQHRFCYGFVFRCAAPQSGLGIRQPLCCASHSIVRTECVVARQTYARQAHG